MTAGGFGYVAACVLAALFVIAAVTKARDVAATRRSFDALGVPNAATFARLVPAIEVTIAVALLLAPPIGGAAALMTLAFFTTFLASRLRAGVRAPCACFGTATAEPLSIVKLVDNAFLIAAGVAATAAARPAMPTIIDVGAVLVVVGTGVSLHRFLHGRQRAT
jgi:uncharacterized membrane protein YphA (DoxX/SURF4 family)